MPTPVQPIRVVLADDDIGICKLAKILLQFEHDIELLATETTGSGAIAKTEFFLPDILVTDFRLPDLTGLEVCNRVAGTCPNTRLLVVSGFDSEDMVGALRMAQFTYVAKKAAFLDFANLLRRTVQV